MGSEMTVCVAVKVHDCIVFAADSASTVSQLDANGQPVVVNVYNNADKVFNLFRGLPIAAMTCGMGHIGGRSISNLAKELRLELERGKDSLDSDNYTLNEVALKSHAFFKNKYEEAYPELQHGNFLEFWVGGYGANNEHGEIWKLSIIDGVMADAEQLNQEHQPQCIFWGGQGEAISRLLLGVDTQLSSVLSIAGVPNDLADEVAKIAQAALEKPVLSATMPVIDTIRLAEFLVQTTVGYFSFAFGADIVGGPADVATVTKYEGFKWVSRKHYYPQELNRNDTDHIR